MYPRKMKTLLQTHRGTPVFNAALFTIAKGETVPFVVTWLDLSEVSRTEKDNYRKIPLIREGAETRAPVVE